MGIADEIREVQRQAAAAYEQASDEQKAIGFGDCFVRFWSAQFGPYGETIVIFGDITSRESLERNEPEAFDNLMASFDRGYRYGWCYSTVETRGEPGSTHVTDMLAITREQFEQAHERDWDWSLIVADCDWAKTIEAAR